MAAPARIEDTGTGKGDARRCPQLQRPKQGMDQKVAVPPAVGYPCKRLHIFTMDCRQFQGRLVMLAACRVPPLQDSERAFVSVPLPSTSDSEPAYFEPHRSLSAVSTRAGFGVSTAGLMTPFLNVVLVKHCGVPVSPNSSRQQKHKTEVNRCPSLYICRTILLPGWCGPRRPTRLERLPNNRHIP